MPKENNGTAVRYPECEVILLGSDGNAVAIFRKVRRGIIDYLVREEGLLRADAERVGDEFQAEATSGDYDHVLITCHRWVTVT